MNKTRTAALALAPLLAAGIILAGALSAGRPAPAVAAPKAAVAAATAVPGSDICAGGVPCLSMQDQSSTVQSDLILYDKNGAPIFWCLNAGGCWVGNDKLGVTGFNPATHGYALSVYLSNDATGTHGQVVIDGQVFTAKDITYLHALERLHPTPR
jgi:hypothetical protein